MAEVRAEAGGLKGKALDPSIGNALPHFLPLLVFPLLALAATHGGWWTAGPLLFIALVKVLDGAFGEEERNMDPSAPLAGRLPWYEAPLWLWSILWPLTLVFSLWQILVADHLAIWEIALVALALVNVSQAVFIIGHELIHRQATWERWLGEFLLASASYPHYATEHVYVHHVLACTPMDSGTAPKGVSFWQLIPGDLKNSLLESWRFARDRLARRRLPVWHHANPFWRHIAGVGAWYALVYWMGGPWALLIYVALCFSVILFMKIINYVQHYGLQRIRLPSGRYEKVRPWHSWSASSRLTNWLFYNMQRHADHHIEMIRHYPLLQHYGEDESPKLPGSYLRMIGLAAFPRRWFKTMDPLVDRWREKFYPEIKDWRAYESRAYAAYPDAFETIREILDTAPLLADWVDESPELLENLRSREFTDLDLPGGFGPDAEFERVARRGLARLYWTREFGVSEMRERIAEIPFQGIREAVEIARRWSNDKTFQICMHTARGSLSPAEAATALSNVAEASISASLVAAQKVLSDLYAWRVEEGSVAVAISGELGGGETTPGVKFRPVIVHQGAASESHDYEAACGRFVEALRSLSRVNLLLAPVAKDEEERMVYSLAEFVERCRSATSAEDALELARTRLVFGARTSETGRRLAETRQEVLTHGAARDALLAEARERDGQVAESGSPSIRDMRGGGRDVERAARFLQLKHVDDVPDLLATDAILIFRVAGESGVVPADLAERLESAAKMWRNLRGILRLVKKDRASAEAATPEIKEVIARACGQDDFDDLTKAIRETASQAGADIDALTA